MGEIVRKLIVGLLVLAAAAVCAGAPAASTALAVEDPHAFDPFLSLTGSCTPSELDPVPDPNCPSGPMPSKPFEGPKGIATDAYGDIYVLNVPNATTKGRIDVFDSEGHFLTEISNLEGTYGSTLGVDSKGNIYTYRLPAGEEQQRAAIIRIAPSVYNPATGDVAYANSPQIAVEHIENEPVGVAINTSNDHLLIALVANSTGQGLNEYGSAEEGNPLLREGVVPPSRYGLAVDAAHDRIYTSGTKITGPGTVAYFITVYDLTTGEKLMELDGSNTPLGKFVGEKLAIAADEGTGHFFVADTEAPAVYEFGEGGEYLRSIEHGFKLFENNIAVDNGAKSPNGAMNASLYPGRYLYVPSNPGGLGHLYAFGPSTKCPPEVDSLSLRGITEAEAVFVASIDPCNDATEYTVQYTTQEQFEREGFTGASTVGEGTIAAARTPREVSGPITQLSPDTLYRIRVMATNSLGNDSVEASFRTYPPEGHSGACPNAVFRTGYSSQLADCRAYELVTPPSTNGLTPKGKFPPSLHFASPQVSPTGDKATFKIENGVFGDNPGTGSFTGDAYLSERGENGWNTILAGPTSEESGGLVPGSQSPDQGYSFWSSGGREGPAAIEGFETSYVRYPDGHSALIGRGSLGTDRHAQGKLISEDGEHIVFVSGIISEQEKAEGANDPDRLEPDAPPVGTATIFDRTADEVTHVVSLLPGNQTPQAGENAAWAGASFDGRGVAFTIQKMLYLRYDNTETFAIGENVTFAGVAEGGARIFYLQGGSLKAFDAVSGKTIAFSSGGTVIPVNIAPDGTVAYFISTGVLTAKANPNGQKPKAGENNLYMSREGTITFVGTVTERDVIGEGQKGGGLAMMDGLGLWTEELLEGNLAGDPSRATPNCDGLLFESRANLTGYDTENHSQVYLFDAAAGRLTCLSCIPTETAPTGEARLQTLSKNPEDPEPLSWFVPVHNLRADGRRAFFESTEPLVAADTDGLKDVYEWEEQGVGDCAQPGGCLNLISSGHSGLTNYIYGVSASGDDVFFSTSDLLLPEDAEATPSIYDARVNGGFPPPPAAAGECLGEACQPAAVAPNDPTPGSSSFEGFGNVPGSRPHCRKVKRHGKTRCAKKRNHKHRHHHHRTSAKKKGAGK
jgi:hypothetical protein